MTAQTARMPPHTYMHSHTRRPSAGGPTPSSTSIPRKTTITVIEPIREKVASVTVTTTPSPPLPKPRTASKKVMRVLVDGLQVAAYFLCICCVLSGDQRPQSKKSARGGYYYQYDEFDNNVRVAGGNHRASSSPQGRASNSYSAKTGTQRIERVR